MEELKKPDKRPHRISLEDRKRLTVTSVEDIDSFNENEVIFLTGVGMMTVLGDDLHISRLNLDDGTLIIEGMIAALDYADHEEQRLNGKRSLIGRVFK
ncbi:MAG: sporulation protein YabP [Christensenellaceae bacterium]|nr:sporulation protein YabP [Christensenellaceae bacterium]